MKSEREAILSAPNESHAAAQHQLDAFTRPGFIRKVYGILSVQLFLTFGLIFLFVFVDPIKRQLCGVQEGDCAAGKDAIVYGLHPKCNLSERGGCAAPTEGLISALYTSMGLSFVFLIAIVCCGNLARKVPHNYVLLFSFTLCEAVMLAVTCLFYDALAVGLAAAMTCLVTAGLTAFACWTKIDFTGMGAYLYAALLTLVVTGFVGSFFSAFYTVSWTQNLYAGCGCLVFSFYIVYDTQLIVGGTHAKHQFSVDDYVFAALNIYLDIINLFLYILQLLSSRD